MNQGNLETAKAKNPKVAAAAIVAVGGIAPSARMVAQNKAHKHPARLTGLVKRQSNQNLPGRLLHRMK